MSKLKFYLYLIYFFYDVPLKGDFVNEKNFEMLYRKKGRRHDYILRDRELSIAMDC